MATTCYKLYGAATTTTDAVAQLDFQENGAIIAIAMDVDIQGADALNEGASWELSFASVSGFTANDTRASILTVTVRQEFLTTGGGPITKTVTISGLNIRVGMGERIFIHTVVGGTISTNVCRAHVYFEAGGTQGVRRPSRRLRNL